MLTHSKTTLEDKKQKKEKNKSLEIGVVKKIAHGKNTSVIGYLSSHNFKTKNLNEVSLKLTKVL